MQPGLVDQADIFALAVVFQLAEIFAREDIGKTENGIERGAQFMADRRQKTRLGIVCLLGNRRLLCGLGTQIGLFGNIARLHKDRAKGQIAIGKRRHLAAHMDKLITGGKDARPLHADIDGRAVSALAQKIDRLQEKDAVRHMDLFDEPAARGIAHPGEIVCGIAAMETDDGPADIMHGHKTGEPVVDRRHVDGCGRDDDGDGHLAGLAVAAIGNAAERKHQRAGNDQSRSHRQRQRNRQGERQQGRHDRKGNQRGCCNGAQHGDFAAPIRCTGNLPRQPQAGHVIHPGCHPASNVTQYAHALPCILFLSAIPGPSQGGFCGWLRGPFKAVGDVFRQLLCLSRISHRRLNERINEAGGIRPESPENPIPGQNPEALSFVVNGA